MKLNDKEITELAQNLAPKEQNAFPNHSDADIWVNGFIEGFKKCQPMSEWVSVEHVLDLLKCTKEILKWHSDKETGLVAGHKLGGTLSFCSARSAIAKMELVLPTQPIK